MKRISYKFEDFKTKESEEFLEILISQKQVDLDINKFVEEAWKEIHPRAKSVPPFDLTPLDEAEANKTLDSWDWNLKETNKKTTTIVKEELKGTFKEAYTLNFNSKDIDQEMVYITSEEVVFVNWWSTA